MENSIYLGLSRQMTLSMDMQIIANNVANMSTPGYRGQNLVFEEYLSDPRGADDELSFVQNKSQYDTTKAGPVKATENPLDIALNGPGFIGVEGGDGQTLYTRAGNFTLNAEGTLLSSSGAPVAGQGGGEITIPAGSTEIKIDEKGMVSNQDGQLGQIMIVEFENPQTLEPRGDNTYFTDSATMDAANTVVKQGYLEGANISPVLEMTRMIETMRTFQQVQNTLQTEHERLRGAIQKLTGN